MRHSTLQALGRDASEAPPVTCTKYSIISQSITDELEPVRDHQITVTDVGASSKRRGSGGYIRAFQFKQIGTDTANVVYYGEERRSYIGDDGISEAETRIDRGAPRSCLRRHLVDAVGAGPGSTTKSFQTSNDEHVERPMVNLTVHARGREHEINPCVVDCEGMSTDIRLGRDVLEGNYLFDVEL